ncbi:cytochrome P450 4F22-like [Gigantopelta aegis]|uniref:cytochrome P450 4F22-like n=1 Tax=Gigantopelta aegis TaxID=1735272 RepID=UPI001B88C487|nr:cytochrome P450 4F22-like [Gigantopelta aegis]
MAAPVLVVFSVVCIITIAYYLIVLLKNVNNFLKKSSVLNLIPHEKPHWLLGHILDYPGPNDAGLKFQREMVAVYPYISLYWLGYVPLVMVSHPSTVKAILKTSEPKGNVYNLIRPWVGDGLLVSKGDKWARNRRLLTPAFHFDILRPYINIKNKAADVFVSNMKRFADRNEYFEVFAEVSMFTLDVILKCAFSYDIDCQNLKEKHPYVVAVTALADLSLDRFFKPWFHSDFIYFLTPSGREFKKHCNFVHKVAEEIIENRQKALVTSSVEQDIVKSKRCMDFLDILLTAKDENGIGLSQMEIRDEVDTFLFEGHDTTASAISWTMFSLAEHPEHQAAVQREVDDLMAGKKTENIEMEDLVNLPYLTMCIKESMRLHTPVPFIQRELAQEMIIEGQKIPSGVVISVPVYNVHHNPLIWDNSTEFRPDRFSPENVEKRDPFAFIPFSAGSRNCIGQNFAMHEIKLILARLFYKYTLELDPNHKVEKKQALVMRTMTGIRMKPVPRVPDTAE